jgi:DNA-directed RNA polymerase specialized sigma24 family protein
MRGESSAVSLDSSDLLQQTMLKFFWKPCPGQQCDARVQVNSTACAECGHEFGEEDIRRYPNRKAIIGAFTQAMRNTLVDLSRKRNAQKHGGPDKHQVTLYEDQHRHKTIVSLDQAHDLMLALSELDSAFPKETEPPLSDVWLNAKMLGMTKAEIAALFGVSEKTVGRKVLRAQAWLKRRLSPENHPDEH